MSVMRGSRNWESFNSATFPRSTTIVKTKIPAVITLKSHTVYVLDVEVLPIGHIWRVKRRYSEFLAFRNELRGHIKHAHYKCPGCASFLSALDAFEFPKKHLFTSLSKPVVQFRVQALEKFIRLVVAHTFNESPKCPTCGGTPFNSARKFLLRSAAPIKGSDAKSIRSSLKMESFWEPDRNRASSYSTNSQSILNIYHVSMHKSYNSTASQLYSRRPRIWESAAEKNKTLHQSSKKWEKQGGESWKDAEKRKLQVQVVPENEPTDPSDSFIPVDESFRYSTQYRISAKPNMSTLWQPWEFVQP